MGTFRTLADKPPLRAWGDHDGEQPILIARTINTCEVLHQATGLMIVLAVNHETDMPSAATFLAEQYPSAHILFAGESGSKKITGYFKKIGHAAGIDVVYPHFKNPTEKVRYLFKDGSLLTGHNLADLPAEKFAELATTIASDEKSTFVHMAAEQGLPMVRKSILKQITRKERPSPVPAGPPGSWLRLLKRTRDGIPQNNLFNVYTILKHHPAWKGVIVHDDFSVRIVCDRKPPFGGKGERAWTDTDDSRTAAWITQHMDVAPTSKLVMEGVQMVAEDNARHPVRSYLESVPWDGVPRVETWLIKYLGALPDISDDCSQADCEANEKTEKYLRAAGKKFLISAVARVMKPPCKADNVLILEGDQGLGKSTVLKILGRNWFSDTPFNLGDKDAFQSLEGKWIIELAELDSFNKAEATRAKAFFSSMIDNYRKSYARRNQDYARQCIFAGSTNQHEYLRDASGNRRYWPVDCMAIDLEGLERDVHQLWSEALCMFNAGEKWWPTAEELPLFEDEQLKRQIDDPWLDAIAAYLDDVQLRDSEIEMNQVLDKCLKIDIGKTGERIERIRVGRCMKQLGWSRHRRRVASGSSYYYKKDQ